MSESQKRIAAPMLALLAGAAVVLPAILFGMPKNNDLANHYHFAIPFYEALRQGHLYPGWLATPNFGYGDVVVRFYPPALYYLLAAGRAMTGNWYAGSLLVITFLSALGSLGAYVWARCYVPRHIAIWAAVFYALMPYRLAEFYQAAQLAEFAAGAALLFALGFTKRVCDQRRWRDAAGLAIAYAGLILSHLPLAVFGSLTLLLYALLNVSMAGRSETQRESRFRLKTLAKLAVAVLLGLGASAFYWVTMIAEMKWIVADGPNPDPMLNYRHNFIFSTLSPENESIWWMGLLAIATIAMCIPAIGAFAKPERPLLRKSLVPLALLLIFSILMSTSISRPLWAVIPYLEKTQHPFRWLAVTSTIAPLLMAASVPVWFARLRQPKRSLALVMAGLVMMAVTFSFSQTVRGATFLSRTTFDQMIGPLKEAPGIIQWLPAWASASAHNEPSYEKCVPPQTDAMVAAGNRAIRISDWSDLKRSFTIEAGPATEARVATFYYPHWIASANGQMLPTRPAADGALLISLPSERAMVNLDFREPPRSKLSGATSIISWTLLSTVFIVGAFVRRRRDHEPIAF